MKAFIIGENEAGQRLDKYLKKRLPEASFGFLYKMLRKKNITLNGKKADGSEKTAAGDEVKFFLSDETFEKFTGLSGTRAKEQLAALILPDNHLEILYEDKDILLINKPSGMLSQKATVGDISANERILSYLASSGQLKEEDLSVFRPSVCNRLDRNTSGILTAGKTLYGLQTLSLALKNRTLQKYYHCLVKGQVTGDKKVRGYLKKDENTNSVIIEAEPFPEASFIETGYHPLKILQDQDTQENYTLLEVHLITGKTHQIRAHLSFLKHPIIGDPKYGDMQLNNRFRKHYGLKSQLLHAYRMVFPDGLDVTAPYPAEFEKIIRSL